MLLDQPPKGEPVMGILPAQVVIAVLIKTVRVYQVARVEIGLSVVNSRNALVTQGLRGARERGQVLRIERKLERSKSTEYGSHVRTKVQVDDCLRGLGWFLQGVATSCGGPHGLVVHISHASGTADP